MTIFIGRVGFFCVCRKSRSIFSSPQDDKRNACRYFVRNLFNDQREQNHHQTEKQTDADADGIHKGTRSDLP